MRARIPARSHSAPCAAYFIAILYRTARRVSKQAQVKRAGACRGERTAACMGKRTGARMHKRTAVRMGKRTAARMGKRTVACTGKLTGTRMGKLTSTISMTTRARLHAIACRTCPPDLCARQNAALRNYRGRRRLPKPPRESSAGQIPLDRLSKPPGELERVRTLSTLIAPSDMCGGRGIFLRREIPFPRAKISTLQFSRP